MKKLMVVLLATGMVIAVVLGAASLASAKQTQIPFKIVEYDCFTGMDKDPLVTDDILHIRGIRHVNVDVSDNPMVSGLNTTYGMAEINQVTGNGVIRGTWSLKPDTIDGTWEGTWVVVSNNGVVKADAQAKGTGELSGKQLVMQLYDAPWDDEILAKCANIGLPEAILFAEGYIVDPGE